MKCASGIQPSPHNSPIYDWAKLLSMRRIKSRARVQEKSAGRDGRRAAPYSWPRVVPTPSTTAGNARTSWRARRHGRGRVPTCGSSPFSADFSRRARGRDSRQIKYGLPRSRAHAALRSPSAQPIASHSRARLVRGDAVVTPLSSRHGVDSG